MIQWEYFDFTAVAASVGFPEADLERLFSHTIEDYRGDRMLAELRMLRTCHAIEMGATTVSDVLHDMEDERRSAAALLNHPPTKVAEDSPPYAGDQESGDPHAPPAR